MWNRTIVNSPGLGRGVVGLARRSLVEGRSIVVFFFILKTRARAALGRPRREKRSFGIRPEPLPKGGARSGGACIHTHSRSCFFVGFSRFCYLGFYPILSLILAILGLLLAIMSVILARIRPQPPELALQDSPWGTAISRSDLNIIK